MMTAIIIMRCYIRRAFTTKATKYRPTKDSCFFNNIIGVNLSHRECTLIILISRLK